MMWLNLFSRDLSKWVRMRKNEMSVMGQRMGCRLKRKAILGFSSLPPSARAVKVEAPM
jgi:hypothetical protein